MVNNGDPFPDTVVEYDRSLKWVLIVRSNDNNESDVGFMCIGATIVLEIKTATIHVKIFEGNSLITILQKIFA